MEMEAEVGMHARGGPAGVGAVAPFGPHALGGHGGALSYAHRSRSAACIASLEGQQQQHQTWTGATAIKRRSPAAQLARAIRQPRRVFCAHRGRRRTRSMSDIDLSRQATLAMRVYAATQEAATLQKIQAQSSLLDLAEILSEGEGEGEDERRGAGEGETGGGTRQPQHAPHLRGMLHHAAVPLAARASLSLARISRTREQVAGALAFGVGNCLMFTASAALHRGSALFGMPWSRRCEWGDDNTVHVLSRLDRVGIFLGIAGGYYGLVGLALRGAQRARVLVSVAAASTVGIASHVIAAVRGPTRKDGTPEKEFLPRWAEAVVCTGLSFAFMLAGPSATVQGMGRRTFKKVAFGGAAYIGGAVCYACHWPDVWLDRAPRWFGSHELFHAGTILGSMSHFNAMFDLVRRPSLAAAVA
uniref:Uncharacterized protein n=1 Tax=Prasinoderma coloniale TaxID=156133 RepID=A0A7R9T8K1_9VIRI